MLQNPRGYSFQHKDLAGADFANAKLMGMDFTDAILDGADFSNADIRGTIFSRSSLIGANFQFARSGVTVDRAFLVRVSLLLLTIFAGIVAGFIGSSITSLLTNLTNLLEYYQTIPFGLSWHTISGLRAVVCGATYVLVLLIKNPLASIISGSIVSICSSLLINAIVIYACLNDRRSWETIGQMTIAMEGAAMMPLVQAFFTMIALAIVFIILDSPRQILIAIASGMTIALISVNNVDPAIELKIGTVFIASLIAYLSRHISKCIMVENSDYRLLRKVAIYLATYDGTRFDRANLTDATFENAVLDRANLQAANLTRTNLFGVKKLDRARTEQTILLDKKVRNLLITHQGEYGDYTNCDFRDSYLACANLIDTNFTGANLDGANLTQAQLVQSNLTRVLAVGTNFQATNLTGACIADWSIDRSTNLTDVECEYVYLGASQQGRTPASGSFEPGGFTCLFQEIYDAVDLIFDRGIDWSAFSQTWQQIQIENSGITLTIRSIENKSGGMTVVKVDLPESLDKSQFHQDFTQSYDRELRLLEARHRAELDSRERELAIHREQQTSLQNILQALVARPGDRFTVGQLVLLKVGIDNRVTVQISSEGQQFRAEEIGSLDHAEGVLSAYDRWQALYRQYLGATGRIDVPKDQITHITTNRQDYQQCQQATRELQERLNSWLDSTAFQQVKELMLQELQPSESIRIVLQTDNLQLRQLPWQMWRFFDRFPHAELAIASTSCHSSRQPKQREGKMQILAIFGDSHTINLDWDRSALSQLPNAQVEFLIEPTRQILTDKLWAQPWDILFYAGHSGSNLGLTTGHLQLDAQSQLKIADLDLALKKSIELGLKLVILNSCDGLGLAAELIRLQLPQAIVMRLPVADLVAQQFLHYFTIAFAGGLPLYQAVRAAREQLQGLEDRFPCAMWLPVICQNPAHIPLTWRK